MTVTVSQSPPTPPRWQRVTTAAVDLVYLRSAGVSLVIDATGPALPRILHWGPDLGPLSEADLTQFERATKRQVVANIPDEVLTLSVLPEQSRAWMGTPGITGHRQGRDFAPRVDLRSLQIIDAAGSLAADAAGSAGTGSDAAGCLADAAGSLIVVARGDDPAAGLGVELVIELLASGLVRIKASLTNRAEGVFDLDNLTITLPVPLVATELLDFTGRHGRERWPQRHPFTPGTYLREGRRGRTGADATGLLMAGSAGFGFRTGQVWAIHTAWSGNHRTLAERTSGGDSILAGGELLAPGEVRLDQGQTYTSPWLYGSWGNGIDEVSARFHRYLRARPTHPARPRAVIANSWEAVGFAQTMDRLIPLVEAAARVGAERFVVDDGWFHRRRDDTLGLGDWLVDAELWPDGLTPLVERVRGLGLQFGLWVEPEMISPDSDVARAHTDWVMSVPGRWPPPSRHQQVLDLANPDAYAYILARLDALISQYDLDYLKWDHNRDLIDPGHPASGRPAVHDQTLAAYRIIDDLKARHPGLEIESCSSGGSRADLGILAHTDRIWTSDCTDAHEREAIQGWTGLLVPPELLGAHISRPRNADTGRVLSLAMRAGTAFFGDLGIEWDISQVSPDDLDELAEWIALFKAHRGLLHSGDVVRIDSPDPALWAHGVVSQDRRQAIFEFVALATSLYAPPGMVRLAGLDPDLRYEVRPLEPSLRAVGQGRFAPPPWFTDGLVSSGRLLQAAGFQLPDLEPDTSVLFALRAV